MGEHTIMVLDLLDKNLDELLTSTLQSKKFTLKTVLMIAEQMVFYYIILYIN